MNATPDNIVQAELAQLYATKAKILMHLGGKYDETKISQSDALFVTGYNGLNKGMGVGSEIEKALKEGKKCFIFDQEEAEFCVPVVGVEFNQEGDIYLNRYTCQVEEYNTFTIFDAINFSPSRIDELD